MLLERIDKLMKQMHPYIPFTIWNIVRTSLDKEGRTVLDIGCGWGEPMTVFNAAHNFHVVGIDIFLPYLAQAKTRGFHSDCVLGDIRSLPFKSKSFDIVVCLDALEHLDREDGLKLIADMEQIAVRQVIVSTPVGEYWPDAIDRNPEMEHKYIWKPVAFRRLGYTVKTVGFSRMYRGEGGLHWSLPKILEPIGNIIWVLMGPLARVFPSLAGQMVCIKRVKP